MIFLLTYLFSIEPERKKKPKFKTRRSNALLVEKFHLMELPLSGVLPTLSPGSDKNKADTGNIRNLYGEEVSDYPTSFRITESEID